MSKTFFIIPGFRHSANEDQYGWLKAHLKSQGFAVKTVEVTWNKTVMTDNVQQFKDFYAKHKADTNYVLGFSFGAMIAAISAPELKPDMLFLCSLSPYFAEDLPTLKPYWRKNVGHRRVTDFESISATDIAKRITSPTTVIYGGGEGIKFPRLKHRCIEAAAQIRGARLLVAPEAPHQIDFPSYQKAIKQALKSA